MKETHTQTHNPRSTTVLALCFFLVELKKKIEKGEKEKQCLYNLFLTGNQLVAVSKVVSAAAGREETDFDVSVAVERRCNQLTRNVQLLSTDRLLLVLFLVMQIG